MANFSEYGLTVPTLLLPQEQINPEKWAVIACDQHTSDPAYWQRVEQAAEKAPSALRLIYPECYLEEGEPDIEAIHQRMARFRDEVLTRRVEGFILVERQTTQGNRLGLVVAIDLEMYDFTPESRPLIRCTEGTVIERLPPRMAIRRGAPLELGHVMVLTDDPGRTLIEPIYAQRENLEKLYDFDLMEKGGHIRGWAVTGEETLGEMVKALEALYRSCGGFLFAVGDGNHSLAAARACWLELKESLSPDQRADHPARYAMVELVNLYDEALVFEPIHRAVFGADEEKLTGDFARYLKDRGMELVPCKAEEAHLFLGDKPLAIKNPVNPLTVAILQPFLDQWLKDNPGVRLDYIHGLEALNSLDALAIRLISMDKGDLFPSVGKGGPLPRKTFSMGEAQDKRYYLECRAIAR